jgi:hypothetical protein
MAGAQTCYHFAFEQTSGMIVPGTTDIGNHGNEVMTTIALPFIWSIYGFTYATAYVSDNGYLQFDQPFPWPGNTCLPSVSLEDPVIFPFWDDLNTGPPPSGIFTSISGAYPNRIFNIEWRATYTRSPATPLNFEVRLYEGQARFDFVYGSVPDHGQSATIGVQASSMGPSDQFSCNTPSLAGVQAIKFDCLGPGPTCSFPDQGSTIPGGTFRARVSVVPGSGPPSTGITVMLNASSVGGGTVALHDDGLPPDAVAGDGVYSGTVSVLPSVAGTNSLSCVVSDAQGRSSSCNGSILIDEAGDQIASAALWDGTSIIVGTLSVAGDVDMYHLHICDPANFSAAVSGAAVPNTQLFLFRPDGSGVAMDDDTPSGLNNSTLTGPLVQSIPAGDYYIAISSYDVDPVDAAGVEIWNDIPASVVRAPDGAGVNRLDHWNGQAGSSTGFYHINLTGISGSPCAPSPCCRNDFNGDGDIGTDLDIAAFFACLGGNCCATCPPNADFNCDGDVGTDADIASFFRVLAGQSC